MEYLGHKNWNHWNVSLWLNNNEYLYDKLWHCVNMARTLNDAARELMHWLPDCTPDGAPYTYTSVRAALKGYKARGF